MHNAAYITMKKQNHRIIIQRKTMVTKKDKFNTTP